MLTERGNRRTEAVLWREHSRAEFPGRLRGVEVAGVDVVMLDADVVGCAATWGAGGEHRQAEREAQVQSLLSDLDRVVPALSAEDEVAYFERLRALVLLLLRYRPGDDAVSHRQAAAHCQQAILNRP